MFWAVPRRCPACFNRFLAYPLLRCAFSMLGLLAVAGLFALRMMWR